MNNLLLWIGGFLVAVLAALFAVPHFVDWTRYRGVFEEEATRILGRDVRVAGAVNLRLLPVPYVRFEKVRLADAAGQTGEPFFRVDDFTLWLSPAPLLRGAIEANRIELRRPIVKLRLNGAGGGNWQTLALSRGSLPFVPSDVALQSVQITDGVISVDRPDGQELGRLEAISGELLATTLEGPFRFRGGFTVDGAGYDLKASTGTFDADGGLRAKAVLTASATANSYTIEGRLADLGGKPHVEGQLSGQIAVSIGQQAGTMAVKQPAAPPSPKSGQGMTVDLRGVVAADTTGANVTDIALAFEQNGKPQLLAGSAQAIWTDGLSIRSELTSRWLDLDLALAGQPAAKPFDVLRTFMSAVGGLVPSTGHGQAIVTVDQINLAAEALSDARLVVQRDQSALRIADLRASLPGGGRLQAAGSFPDPSRPAHFDGDFSVRGASLSRLTNWLGVSGVMPDGRTEGAYALRSNVSLTDQSVILSEASASVAAAQLSGGLTYRWEGRRRLDLVLDGDRIDIGAIAPQVLDLRTRFRELANLEPPVAAAAAKPTAAPAVKPWFDPRASDLTLQIRAGHLVDADVDLRDVDVDLALINNRLTVSRAHFTSARGLDLEAEGEVAEIGVRSRGYLRGSAAATTPDAMAEFAELLGLPAAAAVGLRAAESARVAWSLKLGENKEAGRTQSGKATTELSMDGALLGRRLVASLKLDDGTANWRDHPLDFSLTIEQPDWPRLRAVLGADVTTSRPAIDSAAVPSGDERSMLQVKAAGRASQGLVSFIRWEGEGTDATFSGRLALGADALTLADGDLQLRLADAARTAVLLGLAPPAGLRAIAVNGAVEVALKEGGWTLKPRALDVAGAVIDGDLKLSALSGQRHASGRLLATRASIPRLVDLLVVGNAPVEAAQGDGPWRQSAFDLSFLDRISGQIKLEADALVLTSDLGLTRAVVDVAFDGTKITVAALDGDLPGSRLSSRWLIERAAAGVALSGTAKTGGIALGRLTPQRGRGSGMSGSAALSLTASSRGLTPRGLVAAVVGKGELELTKVDVGGLAPGIIAGVADDVISARRDVTVDSVELAIKAQMDDAADAMAHRLTIGNRKLSLDIADGVVKVRDLSVDTADGRASNRTTIDIASLMIDSEWKLQPQLSSPGAAKAAPAALPAVVIAFVGPLADFGRLPPAISVDALVRELSVRRMERDVAELERLRRLDEERARVEAERLRLEQERLKQETERLRAAAEARATAAGWVVETPAVTTLPSAAGPAAGLPTVDATGAPIDPTTVAPAAAPVRSGPPRDPRPATQQSLKNQRAQDVFKRQSN